MAAGHGDVAAFGAFYDATAPTVVGLLHAVLGRAERVERATREVYRTLWRDAPRFDPAVRSADATLMRSARRVLVGSVRQLVDPTDARPPGTHPPEPTR